MNCKRMILLGALLVASLGAVPTRAWDSRLESGFQLGLPMHRQYTQFAMEFTANDYPEIWQYRNEVVNGALTELHELPCSKLDRQDGTAVGLDLEAKRKQHRGTNEGCDDMEGWWNDALGAYRQGNKRQAFFILGIMAHMVEDMGVPAHANRVHHQGNLLEFDNFEMNATVNPSYLYRTERGNIVMTPEFERVNRRDPAYRLPWRYYAFSQDWTRADAPGYNNRNTFPKTRSWPFWDKNDENLMRARQIRTQVVAEWMFRSAMGFFSGRPNPN